MNISQHSDFRTAASSLPFLVRPIIVLSGSVLFMTAFELIGQYVFPTLMLWQLHVFTIASGAILVTGAAYLASHRYQRLQQELLVENAERRKVDAELRLEREFVHMLLDNLDDGVVACDAEGNLALFNRAARDWHGMDALKLPPEQWTQHYNLYYPDGITPLPTEAIPLQRAFNGETVRDTGMVISARGQPARYILANGGPILDGHGKKIGAIATMHDITESKQAEEALAREQHLMRILMDSIPDTIYFKDSEGRFLRVSRSQAEILGEREPEDAIGKTDFDFFGKQHARDAYDDEQEIIRTGVPLINKEEKLDWPDRPLRWFSSTKVPLRDEAGRIIGTFGLSRDITERKHAEEKLLYMSSHDALTGLFNRAYFEQALLRLNSVIPYPVTVVMIDIDGMKLTNDTYGHAQGDELLLRTAAVLSAVFRKSDIVTRTGGDEFVVLLPQTDSNTSAVSLQRLHLKLAEHNNSYSGHPLSLSVGAATAREYNLLNQTITNADQQMYRNKQGRRAAQ